jgi:uncharacterized protein GlcG (DUF336 family)
MVVQSRSVTRQSISLEAAHAMIAAAEAKAREIGIKVGIAVVDENGVIKAFSRMDGVGVATPIVVQSKAFTAAVYRTPSQAFAERFKDDPARIASFASVPGVTFLPGGLPIVEDGVVIGAIAAGGGTGEQDIECAQAGLAAVGLG